MTPKVPKKALKLMPKTDLKSKKSKKKNYQSFSIYLYRLLRSVVTDGNMRISRKSILILDNFVNDMLERLAMEAGRLVVHGKKSVMTSWEMKMALKLLVPGELANHANIEGAKALDLYKKSRDFDEHAKK